MAGMNFKQIEAFRTVMLTGSMTLAAQQLHTSQPNVSRIIGKLEGEIGLQLFERHAGRIVPTRAAEAFAREVERAFVGLDSVAEAARSIREFGAGTLRVAAAASVSMSVLPVALRAFSARYPSVRVVVDTSESSVIAHWVATRHCDIGFASYVADKPGVVATLLHSENAVCVMPADHRLARRRRITPHDLQGERFISLPIGSASRRAIDEVFEDDRRIMALETPFAATICGMVREGLGLSLVNPIVSRATRFAGVRELPFVPHIPFCTYMLRAQLAPGDTHISVFADCMRAAFRAGSART
jgi:DNA-binding transcriptional LysR family regulator